MSNEIKIKIESTSPVADPVLLKTAKYDNLTGKPKINGVELVGDKSTKDLGIKVEVDTSEFPTREEFEQRMGEIQSVIPATANPQNQLADQGFVNSSIQTATAYFRGDWATWADVPNNPELYPVDATGNRTPTTNDYMVVIADEQTNGGTWRYKYTGTWAEQGKDGWQAEYQVNETPLTAAQLAALNSGITADAVASYVKNTDYATETTGGVIKTARTSFGAAVDGSGFLYASVKTKEQYATAMTNMFMAKGTLENIKDDYVKRGITANTISLTDEEKTAAQAWLGIDSAGGASLPDQTGNENTFLMTDGATPSWSADRLVVKSGSVAIGTSAKAYNVTTNKASVAIGINAKATAAGCVAIGGDSGGSAANYTISIGRLAKAMAQYSIQINAGTNNDANTFKVGNGNGNFEMMDANGNVPLERLTYVTNQIGDISTALTAILGE